MSRRRGGKPSAVAIGLLLLVLVLVGSLALRRLDPAGVTDPRSQGSDNPTQATALPQATAAARSRETVEVRRFYVEPESGVEPVLEQIQSAEKSLDVVVYLLTNKDVVAAIVAEHREGVQIRVMVEEEPFGGGVGNGPALEQLDAAGVEYKFGNPTYRYTHEKAIIVDRERALVMTANLTKSAFTRNRESLALLDSPAEVREAQALFDADWDRRGYQPRVPGLVVSDVNSREKLLALIEGASESLEIHAEVISDKDIIAALFQARKERLRVRIVMSPPEEEESSYKALTTLRRAGVGVRVTTSPYIHAKSILADGKLAYVGSINFTANSMENNRELGILTKTPRVLRALAETFEEDWQESEPFQPGRSR